MFLLNISGKQTNSHRIIRICRQKIVFKNLFKTFFRLKLSLLEAEFCRFLLLQLTWNTLYIWCHLKGHQYSTRRCDNAWRRWLPRPAATMGMMPAMALWLFIGKDRPIALSEKSRSLRLFDLRGVKRYLNFFCENWGTDRAKCHLGRNLKGN